VKIDPMTFDAFRTWLTGHYVSLQSGAPLDPGSARSYISNIRSLSSLIGEDLESASVDRLDEVLDRLRRDEGLRAEVGPHNANTVTALGRYRDFVRDLASRDGRPRLLRKDVQADLYVHGLIKAGFRHSGETQRLDVLERGAATVYVKRQSKTLPFVIHPALEQHYSRFAAIDGVGGPQAFAYYHDSGMRRFPKRQNRGKAPTPYGLNFNVSAIEPFARLVVELTEREDAVLTDAAAAAGPGGDPGRTEREQIILARDGQGRFRADLISIWEKCPITGVARPDLLRASHIKPWRVSDDAERLDPDNGLLLAVHLDALFDKGLITFEDDGGMRISTELDDAERRAIGLTNRPVAIHLTDGNRRFLAHHRAHVFLTGSAVRKRRA
jgi:putative restriction endonuclease